MLLQMTLACLLCATWAPLGTAQTERSWQIHEQGLTCDDSPINFQFGWYGDPQWHCSQRCKWYPGCNFFSYGLVCRLFRTCDVAVESEDPTAITYALEIDKNQRDVCALKDILEDEGRPVKTATDCLRNCMENSQCQYYAYSFPGNSCQLFSACTFKRSNYWSFVVQAKLPKPGTVDQHAIDRFREHDTGRGTDVGMGQRTLTIRVFHDYNKNNIFDSSDVSVGRLPITLAKRSDGLIVGRGETGADGRLQFDHLGDEPCTVTVHTEDFDEYQGVGMLSSWYVPTGTVQRYDLVVPFQC